MKLKTLKDFDACGTCLTEHDCDCPNWDKGKHLENCEIKRWCIFDNLKKEAIKHIKVKDCPLEDSGKCNGFCGDCGVNNWIQWFFNITEEDLK